MPSILIKKDSAKRYHRFSLLNIQFGSDFAGLCLYIWALTQRWRRSKRRLMFITCKMIPALKKILDKGFYLILRFQIHVHQAGCTEQPS